MWQNHNAQPAPPFYTQVRNLDVSASPLASLNMTSYGWFSEQQV